MSTVKVFCVFCLVMAFGPDADASIMCGLDKNWIEEALLRDGKTIEVKREVEFVMTKSGELSQMFHCWPTTYWLKFKHPKTGKTIKWQGEPHFEPVLLDFVNDVPYLVIYGQPDQSNMNKYGCPDTPYIFLRYDEQNNEWEHLQQGQIPRELKDANLAPSYDGTYMPRDDHHPSPQI
ncbi:MAG: hypothetical protein ABI479_12440, partial [Gallionella sp.]